jgi:phage baseplate assembly protein W
MRPTFGAGLRRYLMDPNTPATRAQIALDVQAALQAWEPRITVTSVLVVPGADPAEALVTITYVHVRDQTAGSIDMTVQTAGTGGAP